jgi:hypothetical protein
MNKPNKIPQKTNKGQTTLPFPELTTITTGAGNKKLPANQNNKRSPGSKSAAHFGFITITALLALLLSALFLPGLSGCSPSAPQSLATAPDNPGTVTINFDFQRLSGPAANQLAVWIEEANGEYLKTLYATRYTVRGGFKKRPDCIPAWVEKSGLAKGAVLDAVSGATPRTGPLSFTWDLTDESGRPVPHGSYRFIVEGSLRWANRVLYTGEIAISETEATATASPQFIYEISGNQPAITDADPDNDMIGPVTAIYIPPKL